MASTMLRYALQRTSRSAAASSCLFSRGLSSASAPERKVAILGAAGGIGQPLSLLMKLNPLVSRLALYDVAGTPGVAADVSHINTRSEVLLLSFIGVFTYGLIFWSIFSLYLVLINWSLVVVAVIVVLDYLLGSVWGLGFSDLSWSYMLYCSFV